MKRLVRILWLSTLTFCALVVFGCATFQPRPIEEVPFRDHSQTKIYGNVKVTVAVLTAEESEAIFGVNLYGKNIQPVWLHIENNENFDYYLFPITLDPNYFSSQEAAWRNHFFMSGEANRQMDAFFRQQEMPLIVSSGKPVSGFVFTNLDKGMKVVNVELVGEEDFRIFEFIIPVPGLRLDFEKVDFNSLYKDEEIVDYDEEGLRKALEGLPCCALGGDRKTSGDPLNFVVIGTHKEIMSAFIPRGWHLTETAYVGSILGTVGSSLFGSEYRHSPISPLYLFGRQQDFALQKARETIDERNHMRIWLVPMRFKGKQVWVGQISRDIGIRFTTKTILTHKIDPNVDEAREYLVQDLLYSLRVVRFGYVGGVGQATSSKPQYNYTRTRLYR